LEGILELTLKINARVNVVQCIDNADAAGAVLTFLGRKPLDTCSQGCTDVQSLEHACIWTLVALHHAWICTLLALRSFYFILYLAVWGVEPVVTHQTSWLESTGVCGVRQNQAGGSSVQKRA